MENLAAVEEEFDGIVVVVVGEPSNWEVLVGMLLEEERWLQRWVGAEGREMVVVVVVVVGEEDWTESMMWGILDIEERYLLS
jgi:hypothetical protein